MRVGEDRRLDDNQRGMIDRVADQAADRAIERFISRVSPHDASTHEGITNFGRDLYHANKLRRICETVKSGSLKAAIGAATVAVVGAVWTFIKGGS